jgi:hypothetical protein
VMQTYLTADITVNLKNVERKKRRSFEEDVQKYCSLLYHSLTNSMHISITLVVKMSVADMLWCYSVTTPSSGVHRQFHHQTENAISCKIVTLYIYIYIYIYLFDKGRLLGRYRCRWEDNIKMVLRDVG